MLNLGLLLQNAKCDQVVFHLLKRGQGRLPVVRNGFIVAGVGLFGDGGSATCVEDGLRQRRADRPEQASRIEQVREGGRFHADCSTQRDRRIERCTRDADAIVRFCDAAFCCCDVRATLQELGGQARRNSWRTRIERRIREGEGGGRLAEKNGDRVLELCTLQGDIASLYAGCLKLRPRLIDVRFWSHTAFKAIVGDAVSLFVGLHGIVQQLLLGVGGASLEVIEGKLCLQAQQDGLPVACACLRLFPRCAYRTPNSSPDVDLIVHVDRELNVADTVSFEPLTLK